MKEKISPQALAAKLKGKSSQPSTLVSPEDFAARLRAKVERAGFTLPVSPSAPSSQAPAVRKQAPKAQTPKPKKRSKGEEVLWSTLPELQRLALTRAEFFAPQRPRRHGVDPSLRGLDLFAGAGGFTIGALQSSCPVIGVEYESRPVETGRKAGHDVLRMDVRDVARHASTGLQMDVMIGGPPCFIAGTMILTLDRGYRPIESIAVGDFVLTHMGRWRRVSSVMARPAQPVFQIQAQGVPGTVCTSEHPFYARLRERKWDGRLFSSPAWVPASKITSNHFLAQVLPDITDFDQHGERFWWIVGRYLADGWYTGRYNRPETSSRVYICASTRKADFLEKQLQACGLNSNRQVASRNKNVVRFEISNRELFLFLKPFGKYAHGKSVPGFVFELPASKVTALMDGYLSGDGHREKNAFGSGHHMSFRTVSRGLALSLALLSQRAFGVIASVRFEKRPAKTVIEGRTVNQRPNYVASIPERNRSGVVDGSYGWKKVKKNVSAGISDVYNLSVEEDESYVADGAVVHNCQPFSQAGKRKGRYDPREGFGLTFPAIDAWGPRRVVFENVKDFLLDEYKGFREEVLAGLRARFAYVGVWLLNAKDFGVPQDRERVFLWGAEVPLTPPVPTHGPGTGQPYQTPRSVLPHLMAEGLEALHAFQGGAISRSVDKPSMTVTTERNLYAVARQGFVYRVGAGGLLDERDRPVPQNQRRILYPQEISVLQSFPSTFGFVGNLSEQAKQIGNAVPPPLAAAVAAAVTAGLKPRKITPSELLDTVSKIDASFWVVEPRPWTDKALIGVTTSSSRAPGELVAVYDGAVLKDAVLDGYLQAEADRRGVSVAQLSEQALEQASNDALDYLYTDKDRSIKASPVVVPTQTLIELELPTATVLLPEEAQREVVEGAVRARLKAEGRRVSSQDVNAVDEWLSETLAEYGEIWDMG